MNTPPEHPRPAFERGVFLLAGPSGSGKGTVARALLNLGVARAHVSMGQLLRDLVASVANDPAARAALNAELRALRPGDPKEPLAEVERCLRAGLLIPNEWTQHLIARQLARDDELRRGAWLLDGYPRREGAARHLLTTLRALNVPVLRALHLRLGREELTERLLARGRADDTEGAIARRWQVYEDEVLPTVRLLERELPPHTVRNVDASTPELSAEDGERVLVERVLDALR